MAQEERIVAVAEVLRLSLSHQADERNAASDTISQLKGTLGFMTDLLRVVCTDEVATHIRLSAAVGLKNELKSEKQSGLEGEIPGLSKGGFRVMERFYLKEGILEAIARWGADGALGEVLTECLRLEVMCDWPSRWKNLGDKVVEMIEKGGVGEVRAGLICSMIVTRCHEYKSRDPERRRKLNNNTTPQSQQQEQQKVQMHHQEEQAQGKQEQQLPPELQEYFRYQQGPYPRWDVEKFCEQVFPVILGFMKTLLEKFRGNVGNEAAWDMIRNGCMTFWNGIQYAIPPFLAQGNAAHASQWLDALLKMLIWRVQIVQVASESDLNEFKCWEVKKWIARTFLRFCQRYAEPGRAPKGEQHTALIAKLYAEHYATKVTQSMMTLLGWRAAGQQLSPRVANMAFTYLESALEYAKCWKVMMPHTEPLLAKGLFPYLCFDDQDQETWETNPLDFVRSSEDVMQEFYSPRASALNLLHAFSKTRAKSTVLPFLQALIREILEPYRVTAPKSRDRQELARKKWGVLAVLSSLKGKLIGKKDLSVDFLRILEEHVVPDVNSEFPFLRAKAIWLLGLVASETWDEFSSKLGQRSLAAAMSLLGDHDVGVRCTAATSLRSLMDADGAHELILPNVAKLLEVLLGLMDSLTDSSSIIATIDTLFGNYKDVVLPMAEEVSKRLIQVFERALENMNDADDDEVSFSASQTLQLIQGIFVDVGEWKGLDEAVRKHKIALMTDQLRPILSIMFSLDKAQLFLEELLEIYGAVTYLYGKYHGEELPYLRDLLPGMIKSFNGIGKDYLEDMVPAFDNFLCYDMAHLMATPDALDAIAGVCEKALRDDLDDNESLQGTKVAESLILNLMRFKSKNPTIVFDIDGTVARLMAPVIPRLNQADSDNLRVGLFCNVMQALFYNPAVVVKVIEGRALLSLIHGMFSSMQGMKRIHDKKSTILGLSNLIRTTGLELEEAYPGILRGLLKLQDLIDEHRKRRAANGTQSLASLKDAAIMNGNGFLINGSREDGDSDLEDDEDLSRSRGAGIDALSWSTNLNPEALAAFQSQGDVAIENLFATPEEDEGDFESPLDDVDELRFMVDCVKVAVNAEWWENVGDVEKSALERLTRRMSS